MLVAPGQAPFVTDERAAQSGARIGQNPNFIANLPPIDLIVAQNRA